MQLAALLRFPYWLTQVGCPTPAVMVSHGVGGCLVTVVLFPLVFLICDCAASPSGFCTLTGWVSISVSSLLVYSSGWVGGVLLRPLPQGLQRTLFSLLLVPLGFSELLLLRLLAGVVGLCTLCQGAPVAVLSAWFAGGIPLLPFPYLRVGVVLAKVSPEFVGCEGGLG